LVGLGGTWLFVSEMPPLPPEVAELLAAKDAQIAALTAQVQALLTRVEELERRLGRDSSNSGRPPSSDSIFDKDEAESKAQDRSARRRGVRRPGKQPGAESATLPLVDDPDETIFCPPAECAGCGADLADASVTGEQRRQVREPSPVPPPTTTEYRVQAKVCGCCGTTSVGQAPECAAGRTQYGPEAHARAANLVVAHHISIHRATLVMCQMSGLKVSAGWMASVRGKAAALLEGFITHLTALLRTAPALHVDETPARAEGKLRYVHVACTRYLTLMHTGDRSGDAIDAGGVLPGYAGIIVRDGYSGYAHLTDALHAWCGAHLLRDLKDLYDFEPDQQAWAQQMAALLCQARDAAAAARATGATTLDEAVHTGLLARYRALVTEGFTTNYYRRSATAKDALRIARRFRDFEDLILRFLTRPDLDIFTNNEAERTIRPVKVQMRSSGGCWRSLQGLAEFALVHSYLSTAAKWGIDKLDALRQLFTTGPWLPPALAPPDAA
jgi:transposase